MKSFNNDDNNISDLITYVRHLENKEILNNIYTILSEYLTQYPQDSSKSSNNQETLFNKIKDMIMLFKERDK